MILAIKNADFSSKNIGQIAFNKDIDPEVVPILTHLTRFPADKTNGYVQAFNDLYVNLDESGFMQKMLMLNVPFMASDISECAFNIISGAANNTKPDALYNLGADNEIHHNAEGTLFQATNYSFKFVRTSLSTKVSLFGILDPKTQTYGPIINSYAKQSNGNYTNAGSILRTNQGLFQVSESGIAVHPVGESGSFGNFALPNGAFVGTYADGNFYYVQDNQMRYGEWTPSTPATIYGAALLNWYYPNSTIETTRGMKLFGAAENLSESETAQLYAIIDRFNSAISV